MKRTVRDVEVKGKRVLIRVDFNVPLEGSRVTDDNRIRQSLPTIQDVLARGGRPVLMSHLGRPEGLKNPKYSLKPAAECLAALLGKPVFLCSDCVGPAVKKEIDGADPKSVVMLENLRFYPEEEKNDPAFAKGLAAFGDIYVNDAFGTCHRAHASVEAVTRFLPAYAGFLVEKEVKYLGEALKAPKKPFVAILGGAKVSDKIGVIENLVRKVDKIIVGGAMAYTFLKVKGIQIGASRFEKDKLGVAEDILKKAATNNVEVMLPEDHVIVQTVDANAPFETTKDAAIPDGWLGVDIGPKTVKIFAAAIQKCKTAVWNGPMGIFEMKNFANGSVGVAKALADNHGATSIIGGGDTAACVIQFGLADRMSHISTGGGASLEYLEGKKLPGIEAIPDVKV